MKLKPFLFLLLAVSLLFSSSVSAAEPFVSFISPHSTQINDRVVHVFINATGSSTNPNNQINRVYYQWTYPNGTISANQTWNGTEKNHWLPFGEYHFRAYAFENDGDGALGTITFTLVKQTYNGLAIVLGMIAIMALFVFIASSFSEDHAALSIGFLLLGLGVGLILSNLLYQFSIEEYPYTVWANSILNLNTIFISAIVCTTLYFVLFVFLKTLKRLKAKAKNEKMNKEKDLYGM